MENEKMQVNFAPGMTEATLRVIELHEETDQSETLLYSC